jgi:hypothetical protein
MRRNTFVRIIGLGGLVVALAPFFAEAQGEKVMTFSADRMVEILKNIGDWIFAVAMLIAVVMIIIGATYILMGGGDPTKLATGRKTLLWGGVGLVVALLARGTFTVLRSIMGA